MAPTDPALAERVIANLGGAAQPSFVGQGWLVAVNLAFMTAGFFLCVMFTYKLVTNIWACRYTDKLREPVTIARLMMLCFAAAGTMRFGGESVALWGWNPADAAATVAASQVKRLLDPIAAPLAFLGFGMWILAEPSLVTQLRKHPPKPVVLWPKLHQLKKPAAVVALSFVAAIGVVSTR